jgi:hypothetical protein
MLAFSLVLLPRAAFSAAEAGGVPFEDKARVGEASLVLNGAGVRGMFVIKIYALGLYLPRKTADANQAIAMAGPKRIRLATLREVEAERFLDGLAKGLEKNHSGAEMAGLKPRMDQFAAAIKAVSPLAKGSVVSIDLMPAGATRLGLNGETLGKDIPGEDFYRALLRIWLGDKPAQDSLKADLLGG